MDTNIYKEINYIYYSSFRWEVNNPKSLFCCFFMLFLRFVKRIVLMKFDYPYLGKIFYFEPTINNRKSLKGTKYGLAKEDIVSCSIPYGFFPEASIYYYSIIYTPLFIKFYKSLSIEDRGLTRYFFDTIFLAPGYLKVINNCIIKNKQLKMIVMANDHVEIVMCLKKLAPIHGLITIYTQHASVTEKFPALHFDYSFLDGVESYEKYKAIDNIKGKVFLSGSPRFDDAINKSNCKIYIGIAINQIDDIDIVYMLCKDLIEVGYDKILLRPHPSMEKMCWNKFIKIGVNLSMPSNESSFDFLSKTYFMISNESSIHLDAAIVSVPSALYNFSNGIIRDWYGYLKKGLIKEVKTVDEITEFINDGNLPNVELVRYYNSAYKSRIEGKVGIMIGEFLKNLSDGQETIELEEKYFNKVDNNLYVLNT